MILNKETYGFLMILPFKGNVVPLGPLLLIRGSIYMRRRQITTEGGYE